MCSFVVNLQCHFLSLVILKLASTVVITNLQDQSSCLQRPMYPETAFVIQYFEGSVVYYGIVKRAQLSV